MRDSLQQNISNVANIPDVGVRITYLIAIVFMIAIAAVLVYFKMKESDEKAGI